MAKHPATAARTRSPASDTTARTVPGRFITDNALRRLLRCASLCEQLSGLTDDDIGLARFTAPHIAAIADYMADDLRAIVATASPATGPEPYAETDHGTAQDAQEAALLALWRDATPEQRDAMLSASVAPARTARAR